MSHQLQNNAEDNSEGNAEDNVEDNVENSTEKTTDTIAKKIECVRRYHQQTKHRLDGYANGPDTLDWSMQPNPFRTYQGTEKIDLPFSKHDLGISYCDVYQPGKVAAAPLNLESIATLMELSMGLSAWKEYMGDRWALRCNPSSGNLHPTEAYIITDGIAGLNPGVYHYVSYDHVLEQRCAFKADNSNTGNSTNKPSVLIGLSSISWREAWKYGERAFRYCQLDVGHALAAIRYACALLGWSAEVVSGASDQTIEQLLGITRDQDFGNAEREHPDLLLNIVADNLTNNTCCLELFAQSAERGTWSGTANILDRRHLYDWPIIEEVTQASRTLENPAIQPSTSKDLAPPLSCNTTHQAKDIIQRRRSAQRFDGLTTMESSDFFRILDMLVPRSNTPPWDALSWTPRLHVVLFVHRVNDLDRGLYIMLRNEHALDTLKNALSDKLEWLPVEGAPAHLNLYRLVKANSQKAAGTLSCHQSIASDSAFSLGMLSEFDAALEIGPWAYKQLYWEAGILGQVLYLEAEAIDLQGTGIGCFFDDAFHELLGIKDTKYQSVYHFTVGGALNDSRLRTLMPYEHVKRET